ncbi:MAG: PqqD family protein [Myxococcales bacterium]|nr:PqqD family protein [Myxococcales bacterium]MCB9692624.1 PqqD family protein [Alphaproteobacteria bacterium]
MDKLADLAISDSGFVFDPWQGATFTTNASGLVVLRGLREGLTRAQIVERLKETFDLRQDVDLHRDVDELVGLMRHNELLPKDFVLDDGR